MLEKVKGSIFGAALGDGFGYPTEFMRVEEIKAKWGNDGLRAPLPGLIKVTDDTQMAISVAKAIENSFLHGDIDPFSFESELRKEFIIWLNDPENNRAPGMTCLKSCELLERGLPWIEATAKDSKGCGANMRVNPVAYLKFKDPEISDNQIAKWSQFQAAMTHAHPTALVASELTAIALVRILEGIKADSLLDSLIGYCHKQMGVYHEDFLGDLWQRPVINNAREFINRGWEECIEILQRVQKALALKSTHIDPCLLVGEAWIAEEALGTALLCFLLFPDSSVDTLIKAVNTDGDSDSIACIAGAFAGAYNGISSFPKDWLDRLEYRDELNSYVEFLKK
ncbi:MAG: ADP-ribosylglycohydrolase family protein [Bacteroidia bacterium]|nr:ADP-ribosylglycohydrolase family protein [Bacteroidia bacterium]